MQEIMIPKIEREEKKKQNKQTNNINSIIIKNSSNGFLKDRLEAKDTNFLKVLILYVKLNI